MLFPAIFLWGTKSRTQKAFICKVFYMLVPYVPRVPCYFLFLYTKEMYNLCYLSIYKGYIFAGNNREQGTQINFPPDHLLHRISARRLQRTLLCPLMHSFS